MNDKITVKCIDCGKEYWTYRLRLLGIDRPLSDTCPDCRAIRRERAEKAERDAIELEQRERKAMWLKTSGVPVRFSDVSFDTFKKTNGNTNKIKHICVDYAENFPLGRHGNYHSLGIFSSGVWGNGKSHLACAIAKRLIERWLATPKDSPVLYVTEPDMFRMLRSTFNREYKGESEADVINRLTKVPLLIIDDVGKEEVSDPRFVQRIWFSVINGRYDNMLPVVITANITPDEIATHLGGSRNNEASFNRLYEMVKGTFWENTGESYRLTLVNRA